MAERAIPMSMRTLSFGTIAPTALQAFNPDTPVFDPPLMQRVLMRIDDPGCPQDRGRSPCAIVKPFDGAALVRTLVRNLQHGATRFAMYRIIVMALQTADRAWESHFGWRQQRLGKI